MDGMPGLSGTDPRRCPGAGNARKMRSIFNDQRAGMDAAAGLLIKAGCLIQKDGMPGLSGIYRAHTATIEYRHNGLIISTGFSN